MKRLPLPWPDAPPARLAPTPEDIAERGPDPGVLRHGTQPQPVAQRFHAWAADIVTCIVDTRPPDALRDEIERFSKDFPLIAKVWFDTGATGTGPPAAFELGPTRVSRACKAKLQLGDDELRELLRKHQEFGPVDGLVHSRFPLCTGHWLSLVRERQGYEGCHTIRGPLIRRESDELHIVTLLGPNPETVVVSNRLGIMF